MYVDAKKKSEKNHTNPAQAPSAWLSRHTLRMRNKYLCTRMFGKAFSKSVENVCIYVCSVCSTTSKSHSSVADSVSDSDSDLVLYLDWHKMFTLQPAVLHSQSCQVAS